MKLTTQFLLTVGFLASAMLGGAAASILKPAPVEASPLSAFGLPVKVTALDVGTATLQLPPVPIPMPLATIGSFKLQNDASLVEVTYQGQLAMTGSSGADFEIRIDDGTPIVNTGKLFIFSNSPGISFPATFSGFWQDLSAGEHTISLWVYPPGDIGEAAYINPGDHQGSSVIVKEYLTYGSTYIPVVQR